MYQRTLLSLTLGFSLLQLALGEAKAAEGQILLASNQSGGADTTLYKARWQLPSCGVMKAPEAPKSDKAEVEEEFATPASVEAAEKKAAAAKKLAKGKVAGTSSTAQTSGAEPAPISAPPAVVKSIAPPAVAPITKKPSSSNESPVVRLTISPVPEAETEEAEAKAPTLLGSPPAIVTPTAHINPVPTNVTVPRVPATTTMPASNTPATGAPLPGINRQDGPIRTPGKTASKGNNQA